MLLDRDGEPVATVAPDTDLTGASGTAADHGQPLDDLPRVAHDDPGDVLAGLLDRDQPLVLVEGPQGTWLSTLRLIDGRIRDLRDHGLPDPVVPA